MLERANGAPSAPSAPISKRSADERHFVNYHRVLSRAVWSSRAAGRILLGLLVRAFVPRDCGVGFSSDYRIDCANITTPLSDLSPQALAATVRQAETQGVLPGGALMPCTEHDRTA